MDTAGWSCRVLGMTTHTNCTHPATKAARAACRKGAPQPVRRSPLTAAELGIETPAVDYSTMTYDFERVTCDRCGGTGQYPSSAWNGVCLGCNGKGQKLTRAGRAAKKIHDQWITDHLTIPAIELKPGMKFRPSAVDGWKTVVEIDAEPRVSGHTITRDDEGNEIRTPMHHITVRTQKSSYGLLVDSTVIRSATPDERNALIARIAGLKGAILTPRD